MSTPIGTLGFVPTIQVAGKTLKLDGLKIISVYSQAVSDHIAGGSVDGGLTNYQVPNGKTLRIHAIKTTNLAAANSAGQIGSGTDPVLIAGQSTYPAGDISIPYLQAIPTGGAYGSTGEVACDLTIAQNRYPYALGSGGLAFIQMFGYEE